MKEIIMNLNSSDNLLYYKNEMKQGENNASQIVVVLNSEWTGYRYLIRFKLNDNAIVVTPELFAIEGKISYNINQVLTNEPGILKVVFEAFNAEGTVIKSAITNLRIAESLAGGTEIMPEDMVPWYTQAVTQAGIATTKAQEAATSAETASTAAADAVASIQAQFDAVVAGVTTDSEVIIARGNEATLGNRLDKFGTQINDLDALKHRIVKPIITFSMDDGTTYDYTHIYPLFQNKGIVATTGAIADKINTTGFMNITQIKELQAYGWEIASHGKTHTYQLPTLNDEDLYQELKVSKDILNNNGLNVKNILVPFGATDERVMKECSKYYRAARVSGYGITEELNKTPINTYRINSIVLGDTTGTENSVDPQSGFMSDTLDYWKYWVDKAITDNSWIVFIMHSDALVSNNRLNDLSALIDYVQGLSAEILTLDKALNSFENMVDADKFKVGADGKIAGEYGRIKQAVYNTIVNETPISSLENMLTYNTVTVGTGFPENLGGTLITFKSDNDIKRTFQLMKPYGKNKGLYIRDFDTDTPESFRNLENIYIHPTGSILASHTPVQLKNNMINFAIVSTANATGFPENTGGLLTAYFINGDYSGLYETYKVRNTNKIYTRYWDSNIPGWSSWVLNVSVMGIAYNTFTPTDLIGVYPSGVSYCQITSGGATGFPEDSAGVLETNKTAPNGYIYQYYHLYNSTKTYKRVYNSSNAWSNWVLITTS